MTKVAEQTLDVECQGCVLPGVLTLPTASTADLAVLIVVGGPQYRVGSHRQFVQSARTWAGAGWPVLRFDVRGMGDADGQPRGFEDLDHDIAAAIDALMAKLPLVKGVVLFGLCDGASAALMYCARRDDARVRGLCLLNPWLRSPQTLARTHLRHYYVRRLLQREFWAKLATGRIGRQAMTGLMHEVKVSRDGRGADPAHDFRASMCAGWTRFRGPILLAISGSDLTAREFDDATRSSSRWRSALNRTNCTRLDIAGADHTLSRAVHRQQMDAAVLGWLAATATQESSDRGT